MINDQLHRIYQRNQRDLNKLLFTRDDLIFEGERRAHQRNIDLLITALRININAGKSFIM
jgi:hypothetical protein